MNQRSPTSKRKFSRGFIITLIVIGGILVIGAASLYALRAYFLKKNYLGGNWKPSPNNCQPGYACVIIENGGKVKVSNTPEVQTLARRYGWEHVHIQALDINLVKDIEFINQIHPNFKEQTGCIIIAHAGDDGYVYQEDKALNIVYRETLDEFIKKTKGVDSDLMSKFYLSFH